MNGRDRSSARTRTGGARFTSAAFEKPDGNARSVMHVDKLDVCAMRKFGMSTDLGAFRLPSRNKLPHEDYKMRVAR